MGNVIKMTKQENRQASLMKASKQDEMESDEILE